MLNNSTITYIFFVKSKHFNFTKKKIYTFIITMNKIGFQTWQNYLLPKTKKSFTAGNRQKWDEGKSNKAFLKKIK